MRRFTEVLGRLCYPEDEDPGDDGDTTGPPDPLDDYSQVSIPEEKLRLWGRGAALRFLVEFLPLLLVIFVYMREVLSSPQHLGEATLLVLFPVAAAYLLLVWFDTGRWGLVHPVFTHLPLAYQHFREDHLVFQVILGLDLLLAATIALFILSGSIFLKNGIDFLLLLVGIGLFVNITIIMIYAIEWPAGEFF